MFEEENGRLDPGLCKGLEIWDSRALCDSTFNLSFSANINHAFLQVGGNE